MKAIVQDWRTVTVQGLLNVDNAKETRKVMRLKLLEGRLVRTLRLLMHMELLR